MIRPPSGRLARRAAVDVGLAVVTVGLVLSGLILMTLARAEALDKATGRQGAARVLTCLRSGPISGSGLGYWWTCTVEVDWDSGAPGRYVESGSLCTPDDQDRQIQVHETIRSSRGNLHAHTRLARPDRPARISLLAGRVLLLLAGALCGLRPAFDIGRTAHVAWLRLRP